MIVLNRRHFRIVIFIGGVNRALIRQFLGDPNTIIIVFDNRNEIARNRKFFHRHGVIYFELGPNSTSYELVENADSQVREAGHKTANFNTNLGKGARPVFGYLAALARLQQPDFLRFLDQLYDRIMKATGGCPESVQFIEFISSGGATGGGTGTTIESIFVLRLSAYGFAVQSIIVLLGPVTFTGAAPRARQIGAATLAHILATYSNSPSSENRIARTIYAAELPPLGKNQTLRDQFLHVDLQAFSATALQYDHAIEHPNNAATHELGHFYSREIDIVGRLPQDVVAGQLAIALRKDFDLGVQSIQVMPGLIERIFTDYTWDALDRPTISRFADNVDEMTADSLMLVLKQPGYINHVPLTVQLFDGRQLNMSRFCHDLRRRPKSFHQTQEDLMLCRTLAELLPEEIAECEALIDHAESVKAQVEDDVRTLLPKVQSSNGRRRSNYVTLLLKAMQNYRDVCDELQFLDDVLTVVHNVRFDVDDAARIYERDLHEAQSVLLSCHPSGEKLKDSGLVIAPSLDEAYPKILSIAKEDPDSWLSMLAELALGVTVHGLARIAEAPSTEYDQIADSLLHRDPEVAGPPMGSVESLDPAATYLVLPNAPLEVREEVAKAVERSNVDIKLFFTDGISFGAAAVRFRFRQFLKPKEIFDGPILEELNRAYHDPAWRLNFINGTRDIEALGGKIVDGNIVFPDPEEPKSL